MEFSYRYFVKSWIQTDTIMKKEKDPLLELFSNFELKDSEVESLHGGYVYRFHTDTGTYLEEYDSQGNCTTYNILGQEISGIPCNENYL